MTIDVAGSRDASRGRRFAMKPYTSATRTLRLAIALGIASLVASASGCTAMHEQAVQNLRAQGQHARADCYAKCEPGDAMCTLDCDNAHPYTLTPQQQQLIGTLVTAAAMDQAKARANGAGSTSSAAASTGSSGPGSSSGGSTASRTLEINGKTYTGGASLGKPCSLDAPCPDGYTCNLVTNRSGQCVQ
jgi:uncharacterized membrane protein YgcG